MKRPRPRLTVRRLMFIVAIAGLVLGLIGLVERRAARFRREAAGHKALLIAFSHSNSENDKLKIPYFFRMWHKYKQAARRPWLPVEPDPPMPE